MIHMNKRFSLSRSIAAGRDGQPPGVSRVSCNGDFTLRRNSRKLLQIVKISILAINLLILTKKRKYLLKIVG